MKKKFAYGWIKNSTIIW